MDNPSLEIDARLVAPGLGLEVDEFQRLMEIRKIKVLCERGTGEDLGTTPADMAVIARRTRFVHGVEGEGRVVARYLEDNPNGSLNAIAGVTNARGNVVGLMPHPEHAVEELTGSGLDGLGFFTSLVESAFA